MLDVRRDGVPITEHGIRNGVRTGVTFGVPLPGLVPLFEEARAWQRRGMTEDAWRALAPDARALAVAHDRLSQLVETHTQDAVAQAQERRQANRKHAKDW